MLAYALQVFTATAVLLLCYRVALAGRPYYRASRLMLYAAVVLPLLLPLLPRGGAARPTVLQPVQVVMPDIIITPGGNPIASGSSQGLLSTVQIGCGIYALVAFGLLAAYGVGYRRWVRRLRAVKGECLEGGVMLKADTGFGPGSFGRVVFFPGEDCDPAILRHEVAHVRLRHFKELCGWRMACCLLWPHLLLWLVLRWLRSLQEYEADHLAATSHDRESYTALLLQATLGAHFPIPQTFSFQPLKNRIVMLYKEQTSKGRRQAWASLATLVALTVGATMMVECKSSDSHQQDQVVASSGGNTIALSNGMAAAGIIVEPVDSVAYQQIQAQAVLGQAMIQEHNQTAAALGEHPGDPNEQQELPDSLEGNGIYKTVAHMPEFNGNVNRWLAKNIRYPEGVRKAKQQGRVVTKYVVDVSGAIRDVEIVKSSGVKELDDEAVRAIGLMPNWRPGRTKNGQTVPVRFFLPVTFKLD